MTPSSRLRAAAFGIVAISLVLAAPHVAAGAPGSIAGTVLETVDAGGYTYVRLDTGGGEIWAAGPKTAVRVGDRVELSPGATMTNFHSDSLDRTFASIQFVSAIRVGGGSDDAARGNALAQAHGGSVPASAERVEPVPRAEGGLTVVELHERKRDLAGKPVSVRGRVVKLNNGILGRNWIHVQDGTGASGTHDLTVTTDAKVRIGDVVLVRGTAAVDRDFGMGYRYDLIVEDATVTVE